MSCVRLVNVIFGDWEDFKNALEAGPNIVRSYLLDEWRRVRDELVADPNKEVLDANRELSINDFDITINKTKKGTQVFFITLPDYDYRDATGKYIALALTPNAPRYFMLEYSEDKETHEPVWVIGELRLNNGDVEHRFIDVTDNMRLTWFAGYILGMLDAEEE